MHNLFLWLLWLEKQLEKPDANPAEIYREHRGAFGLARAAFSHETVLWKRTEAKEKAVYDCVGGALAYLYNAKLNKSSRSKSLRLVSEAVSALQAAGYDIPF